MENVTIKSNNVANATVFVNLTPHDVVFNDGRVFKAVSYNKDDAARVSTAFTDPENDVCHVTYGAIDNLPEPRDGVKQIVSGMVLAAAKAMGRTDCVAPATGRRDTVRTADNKGIISVKCFVDQYPQNRKQLLPRW